jgi:hypothetical protein
MIRGIKRTAVALTATVLALMLVSALAAATAGAAGMPLGGGEARVALAPGLVKSLSRSGVELKPIGPAVLKGRKLTLPVSSGSYDPAANQALLGLGGGFRLVAKGMKLALRKVEVDAAKESLSAVVGGKRIRIAALGGAKLEREGFDARLEAGRLRVNATAAARLNRGLGGRQVFRAGASLGSLAALAEPSEVDVAFGSLAIGGPETTFSRLEALKVEMGIWGSTMRWGGGSENFFIFDVAPTRIPIDASAGILDSGANDGISMEIFEGPPRQMLLRHPQIDIASRELTATISPLSQEGALTAPIATLDYSAARFQVRPKVGAVELMGIRAIANQFIADQLNARFQTPGYFQAGETFARVTATLHY